MILVFITLISIFVLSYLYITNGIFIFVYNTLCMILGVVSSERDDCILMKRDVFIHDKHIAKEYNIIYNDKNHDLVFIAESDEIDLQIKDCFSNISEIIPLKKLIVYCGIKKDGVIEGDIDIDIDITDMFRYFVYYYDKDISLDIFLKYILHKGIIIDSIYDAYIKYIIYNECSEYNKYSGCSDINKEFDKYNEYKFVLYLNDHDFTEIVYDMKSIKDIKFKELLS